MLTLVFNRALLVGIVDHKTETYMLIVQALKDILLHRWSKQICYVYWSIRNFVKPKYKEKFQFGKDHPGEN